MVGGYAREVKAFVIYTAMRLGLFVACYAVFGAAYVAALGKTGALLWPFIAAVVVSSLLSLKLLAPQRERFARVVETRAARASENFEKRRAKEDVD
jgi:membrane protein implicated in regulation of membrane protease activity